MNIGLLLVIIYFFLINIFTFVIWGIDKRKAQHQKWRIKEKTLLRLAFLGGCIGALIGMNVFHHKTIKGKFLVWFMLITFFWILLLATFSYFWRAF